MATVCLALPWPATAVVATSPAIRIRLPAVAAYLMPRTRPVPAGRRSCPASSRRQLIPSADRKITGLDFAWSPPGTFVPTAMKPPAVRRSARIWSPGTSGIPGDGARVQVRPSALVQIEPGPTATHRPWPPATKRAACPGGGAPPDGVRTVPVTHACPSFGEKKNCARAMRAPVCEPTATISAPSLATRARVWLIPRPPGAGVNWRPASVAGGKPRAVAGGAGPELLLFAPAMTTTATPNTIMARIGTPTLVTQPRNCSPARKSENQVRLGGGGSSERSSFAHSVLAVLRSDRPAGSWPALALAGAGPGTAGPGTAGRSSSGHADAGTGTGTGWLTVGVYLKRPGSGPAGSRRGPGGPCGRSVRPAEPRSACAGPVPRGGRDRQPSNSNPGTLPASPSGGARPRGNRDAGGGGSGGPGRRGRGGGGPSGPRASSASGLPLVSLVTCALPSRGGCAGGRD